MVPLLDRWITWICLSLTGLLFAQNPKLQAFAFDPATGVSNRLVTPNGDNRNDVVVFTFSNPRDSAVSGSVYDLQGKLVSAMEAGPNSATQLRWDGKSGGSAVSAGVYLYLIEAEEAVFSGTVVVVK